MLIFAEQGTTWGPGPGLRPNIKKLIFPNGKNVIQKVLFSNLET